MKNSGKTLSSAGKHEIATLQTQGIKNPVTEPYRIKQAVGKKQAINDEHRSANAVLKQFGYRRLTSQDMEVKCLNDSPCTSL